MLDTKETDDQLAELVRELFNNWVLDGEEALCLIDSLYPPLWAFTNKNEYE